MNLKTICQKEIKAFELLKRFSELKAEYDSYDYELERARGLCDYYYSLRVYYFNNCQEPKPRFLVGGFYG